MDNVALLKQTYQNFEQGNVPAVLAEFDSNIEWNECKGFTFVKGDGIFRGPEAVVENVFAQIPEHFEGFRIEIDDLFGAGDKVVMQGHYKGVWKATQKPFIANATHVWTVKNGKLTHFFQAVDTAEIINL